MEPIYNAIRIMAETKAQRAAEEGKAEDAYQWLRVAQKSLVCTGIWNKQADALVLKGGA